MPPEELIQTARRLGDPAHDAAILAEGNLSFGNGDGTFWVKASGHRLENIGPDGFARVRGAEIRARLDDDLGDDAVRDLLDGSSEGPRPSVETFLHAVLLNLEGVGAVLHAHPTATIALSCHPQAERACAHRLFPDEIVLGGSATLWVPYVDPGLPLARELRDRIPAFVRRWGEGPRLILLGNHGLIALGPTLRQAEASFWMGCKAGRVWLQALQSGWPNVLSGEQVARIAGRPDEHHRQRLLGRDSS